MFLGAIAGFLGVYLIAKTDPAQTGHAIAFSLACGVFWGPVISGAEAIVTKEKTQAIAQAVATQHDELKVTKAAMDAQANHLQASLAEVTRQAEAVERARQKLLDVTRSTSHLSPNVRTQLEQITTATIHRQLDRSSANLDTIQRELKATELAPLNSRIFTRDE
jgi:capsule polysaccharide export protein KpsE/RkpR